MIFLRSLLFHIVFYGGTIVIAFIAAPLLLAPAGFSRALGRFWGIYALFSLKLAGVHFDINGKLDATTPVIYAAKHQSTFETMILYHILSAPLVVLKKELLKLPVIGKFLARSGAIALDRSARISALKKLRETMQDKAGSGHNFLIFPQGTRVDYGKKAPYKVGVFALYEAANIPVIPIALNTGRFLPHGKLLIHPGRVQISILPAIEAGLPRKSFMTKLEASIEDEMDRLA